jgi:molybdopterin-guanine dinucleotide biosynthesis protein
MTPDNSIQFDIAGVFGPKKSGKTTLAKHLALACQRIEDRPIMVYCVNDDETAMWVESGATVHTEEEKFWPAVWAHQNQTVIIEESAATINRDRDLVPVFTRIRHCHHRVIVIGHSGADLLPVMRQQIDMLCLFRQPPSAAKIWAECMCDEKLLGAEHLERFYFLRCVIYEGTTKHKLKL